MTKFGLGIATAMMIAVSAAQPASAGDRMQPGAAAALGLIGGLAAGAAIGSSMNRPYYPGQPVEYAPPPPPPVYYAPPPRPVYYEAPGPECIIRQRRFINEWGEEVTRRERVCR